MSRHRAATALRAAGILLTWVLVGATIAMAWLATGGEYQKVRAMTVLSGSMTPALGVGDLVVAQVVAPTEVSAGDVVTFRDSSRERFVTHRVQSIVWRGNLADVITRGDANLVGEEWTLPADGTVGRVVLRIPYAGYVVGWLGTPAGQIGLAAVAMFLAGWAIRVIWRPAPAEVRARAH